MRIQVKDFMSSPVITATGEESVEEIRGLMNDMGINAIPIISYTNDKLKVEITIEGIITATDLSKEVHNDVVVNDIMIASNVQVVHVDTSAQSAAKMMLRHNVHHIVVMDDGKIKGMISSLDFVKLVAEYALS